MENSTFTGLFWKCARIGERLSPYISVCCVVMAVSCTLIYQTGELLINDNRFLCLLATKMFGGGDLHGVWRGDEFMSNQGLDLKTFGIEGVLVTS